jgi:hypothetical protein
MGTSEQNAPLATDFLPRRLRWLASRLRTAHTIEELHAVVTEAVKWLPGCSGLEFERESGDGDFERSRLTVPLVGASVPLGVLRLSPGSGDGFDAGDLHLAGAVADLSAAVIDRCLVGDALGTAAILSASLDGLPMGVLCFNPSGALVFANTAAGTLLDGRLPANRADFWRHYAPPDRGDGTQAFIWQGVGKLVHVVGKGGGDDAPAAVVLTDLSPRVVAFCEHLAAACWRCQVEHHELALGLLAGPEGSPLAIEAIERPRARLPAGAKMGPVDARTAGIVVAGMSPRLVHGLLRTLVAELRHEEMSIGVAPFREGVDTPESLLTRTMASLAPVSEFRQPEVLVYDESPGVAESVGFVLRQDCVVTTSADRGRTLRLLGERLFSGLVLELPAGQDTAEVEWLRHALSLQPDVSPVFVTEQPGPWDLVDWGLPPAPVFRKPFAVQALRQAVRGALSRSGGEAP